MKKGTVTRLCGLILLLAIAAIVLPKTALAATYTVESGKEYTANTGDKFTFTLSSKKEVAIIGDETLEIWYGVNSEASDYKLDMSMGGSVETLDGRTWYFRVKSGRGSISFTWGESNDTPARATEFSLEQGKSRSFNDKPGYRYYLLNVKDASARYTFSTDNDVVHMDIFKGKITEYKSAARDYRVDQGQTKTFTFQKGYYTIAATSISQPVQFTVKREKWVGITKIKPSNDGKIIGTVGQKFDYEVYYEPKNADAKISVKSASSGSSARMKLKSQRNGVAVFEVDFTNNDETKTYTLPYSSKETTREFNRVIFTSDNGITAKAEKMAGPAAPTLYQTMTASTKTVSIPVQAHPNANKFVAYVKSGSGWTKAGETKENENGVYYVKCTNLKAGKNYTFRVYAYADGVKGGYLEVKGGTAYKVKPTKAKAKCTKAVFHKKQRDYEWKFSWNNGWYKVPHTDYTALTIKVTFKKPKKAKGTYVIVNGQKLKSGKKFTVTKAGKTKAGQKYEVYLQSVRKVGQCIAFGPSVKIKCKLKAAK